MNFKELPAPSPDAISHANQLVHFIVQEIEKNQGKISFERFMELALYAKGLGYYSAGCEKIGPAGDFITAPETSALFSCALAKKCAQILSQLQGGDILEFGAGSGKMALDILNELDRQGALPNHYFILETSAPLKQRQKKLFARQAKNLLAKVKWVEKLPADFKGIMLANEVLDAFPVQRFRALNNKVEEYYVGWKDNAFYWLTDAPESTEILEKLNRLRIELGLENNYVSEINLRMPAWLNTVANSLSAGVILLIDYGFPRSAYYHPDRCNGTLMCHYRHHAHPDPLILVGLQDITAHVDFTLVAESALAAGLTVASYATQAAFLIDCGILELYEKQYNALAAENALQKTLTLSQQMQTLTMPHEMGELFKAMVLTKNMA
jgi:SAM-dependent MidA family methyltransferase